MQKNEKIHKLSKKILNQNYAKQINKIWIPNHAKSEKFQKLSQKTFKPKLCKKIA
jgi:hypothetical protein